jgi:hypothetical protein
MPDRMTTAIERKATGLLLLFGGAIFGLLFAFMEAALLADWSIEGVATSAYMVVGWFAIAISILGFYYGIGQYEEACRYLNRYARRADYGLEIDAETST